MATAPPITSVMKEFKLLMSHPFCLGEGPAPVQRGQRKSQAEVFKRELAALGYRWDLWDLDGVLPAVFKKRKDVLLVANAVDNAEMMAVAVEANSKYESKRTVVSVSHSAYLWDFGCGAVDVIVTFRLKTPDGLLHFYETAEAFEEGCFEKDLYYPPGFKSWDQLQQVFSRVLRNTGYFTLSWLKKVGQEDYKTETCTWSASLVWGDGGNDSISIPEAIMTEAFVAFCGSDATETTFKTGVREISAAHTGYSGNMALVDTVENEARVIWLWKVVALLFGTLLESVEPMYDVVVDLIDDGKSSASPTEIRQIRMILDLLHNEANPVTICSESFDQLIYENVWINWGGVGMDKMVDDRADFLAAALTDLAAQQSQALQGRLNFVVFVLTLVSVASTVASVIQLIDFTNADLTSDSRAVVLGVITGIVGAMCAMIVTVDVNGYIVMCSKCRRRAMQRAGMATTTSGSKRQLMADYRGSNGKLEVKVDDA